jgi:hypothetical protein
VSTRIQGISQRISLLSRLPDSHSNINLLPSAAPLIRKNQGRSHSQERSMSESPIYNHDPIEEIQPDVFMLRGCIRMNALMTITPNMAIVRHGDELTLVDSIRLSQAEEKRLESLGTVKRILRLGYMHGSDDAYYMDR